MFLGRSEMGASKNGLPGMAWPVSPTAGRLATSAPTSDAADAATEPSGEARPPVRFEDAIAERLNKRAEEEFELGIAYFREGDLIQARDHFDLTKNLWLDQARPHVASMVVSFQAQNYYQAVNDELRALQLAKTLDDLRIDGFVDKFYSGSDPQKKQQAFNRTVELVNRMVQGAPDTSLARVLLAHYSWVNGDLSTAVSAADAVARTAPEPNAGYVRKFRDMLVEEQQAGEAKATTQPAAR